MPRMPGWHAQFQRIIFTGDRDATAVVSGLLPLLASRIGSDGQQEA